MQRRDFFKAISAAAAAIAAGSTALAKPKTTVAVSADTSGFVRAVRKSQASLPPPPQDPLPYVKEVLKECRVIGHELSVMAGELTRCRVSYRHDPKGRRTAEDLRWDEYLADAKMVSIVVNTTADAEPVRDVEIEYILLPKRSQQ